MTTGEPVAALETNLSQLFFTADRVYKILKPVVTPFIDFSEREARLEATTTEYDVNRRISPDVYLGVSDLEEHGVVAERMITMRRLPADGELNRLLARADRSELIEDVAGYLARFHCALEPISDARVRLGGADTNARNWSDNLATLAPFAGAVIDADDFDEVAALQQAYLDGRAALFEDRCESGWIRDGHGDLRGEHLYLTGDGWRLIDSVAFRDDFRIADVLSDIAFLAMDLHRQVGPDAAMTLMQTWAELTNEHHPSSLAHFYVAYRAHVRSKVECLRFADGHVDGATNARTYHQLALEHLRLAQVRLVLVGGGAGTGKSTVAEGLAKRIGAVWIRSDEVRKDVAGIAHDEHAFAEPGTGIYDSETSAKVMEEIARQTEILLNHGTSVVIDATWSRAEDRAALRAIGTAAAATPTEIRCDVARATAKERIASRMASVYNPSDATPELVDYLLDRFEPWPEANAVSTAQPVPASIAEATAHVGIGASPSAAARRFRLAVLAAGYRNTGFVTPS